MPLIFDNDHDIELKKLDYLNGVLYCGGDADAEYYRFGKKVYDKIVDMNKRGIYMPIWGTCLGM